MVAAAALLATSCDGSAPKADLSTPVDSLSYAIGAANAGSPDQLAQFLQSRGFSDEMVDEVLKGIAEGLNTEDKKTQAYQAGIAIGNNIRTNLSQAGSQLLGDSTATLSYKNIAAGFIDVMKNQIAIKDSTGKPLEMAALQNLINSTSARIKGEKFAANRQKSADFIAKKAKEAGVKQLAPGVYYKELKAGTGAVAKDGQLIKLHYEGKTIDGKVFDSSYSRNQPVDFAMGQAIAGFDKALKQIPMGATWEVYIDQEQAYGAESPQPAIEPFSALVFKIEAIEAKDAPKQAGGMPVDLSQIQMQ